MPELNCINRIILLCTLRIFYMCDSYTCMCVYVFVCVCGVCLFVCVGVFECV